MTAFFIDLSAPQERALIASDTLVYSMSGEHAALGFTSKVISIPHHRGALFGSGLYDIHVRAAAELMLRPELSGFNAVVDALPAILRDATADVAAERDIADPGALMLFAAGWIGWCEADRRVELALFENYEGDYAPRRGYSGLIGIPNISPAYVPPGFSSIVSPEVRAMAALRAIRRFIADKGEVIGLPPIGGEIVLTEVHRDGVSSRVVGRFDDYAASADDAAETWAEITAGERDAAGLDLVHRAADRAAAAKRIEDAVRSEASGSSAPGMTRQQRRAAEKAARKANRRAA